MKLRIIISAIILVVLLSGITLSAAPMINNNTARKVEKAFSKIIDSDDMSGAIYAVCDGEVVYDKGKGEAVKGTANSPDVVYAVASVTKQFTAAAIMMLYEQGKLDLDDKLDKYFPDYKYGKDITLRMLMYQRSGIPDYSVDIYDDEVLATCYGDTDIKDAVEVRDDVGAKENREEIRKMFLSRELLFEPDKYFDYSDSNYALLAEVVPIVTGVGFHDFIRRNIFDPIGMTNSAFIDEHEFLGDVVIAEPDHEEFEYDYFEYYGAEYGCGDIMLTPKDLYKWYRALFSGRVVSKENLKLITTNYSSKGELGYGFGLMISDEGDTKAVYHYGWIPSFYSSVFYVPEIDYFQTVLSNRSTGNPHKVSADLVKAFCEIKNVKLVNVE